MREAQMFKMDRKLQITQNKYDNVKRRYVEILREMIEEGGTDINNLNIDDFIEEYAEKLMKVRGKI